MVSDLLKQHRAGHPKAGMALVAHFSYLADEQLAVQRRLLLPYHRLDELRSNLQFDLVQAVRALKKNKVKAIDLERYLAASLQHSFAHYAAEVSDAIDGLTRTRPDFDMMPCRHPGPEEQAIINENERLALAATIKLAHKMFAVASTSFERSIAVAMFLGIELEDVAQMMAGPSLKHITTTAQRLVA